MKRGTPGMCIVNPSLVPDIASLTGSQSEIMRRAGISWNSWIKVCGGLPIRLSVGRRFKDRVLARAHESECLRRRFPGGAEGGIDHVALDAAFLRPVAPALSADAIHLPPIRSVRRARQLLVGRYPAAAREAAAALS
ncbi:hypothetical protein [Sphingosinicella soli]|uniref:Uncharacterized protein n=1 Tax=Sphingosinicella soli TaxID=333708 RepID=A0A7W7B3R4_9SPHN|nr:hypothetical protein [Sphingosinicella soli]MBB4633463.1 hypothetical protein [Sphingosinicella soli]